MKKFDFAKYIEEHTLRLDASRRGGGIEIDASNYLGIEDAYISAFQNYLGGGMLGAIQSDNNFKHLELGGAKIMKRDELTEELKKYFHKITNEEAGDEAEYESVQSRPGSAY